MSERLRVLLIEDCEDDAFLEIEALKPLASDPFWRRVESTEGLRDALDQGTWDLVISDFTLPSLDGYEALEIVRRRDQDVPFVLVTGTVGEAVAAEAMRRGANDCILKGSLVRLIPAVERELRDSHTRRERRRAEEALKESEHRYRSLVEQALDGIVIASPTGHILGANPSALAMTGYEHEEMVGKRLEELWVGEGDPMAPDGPHRCRARRQLLRKDRSQFDADISVTPLEGDRALLVVRDVSEQVRAEERLHYRGRLHRGLANLGREVAAGTEKNALLQFAASLAAETLGMDFCRITEQTEQGAITRARTGCPMPEHDQSCTVSSASMARVEAASGPVNFEPDEGSAMEACLRENGIARSYSIAIGPSRRTLAVMDLHSRTDHELTGDETSFLESMGTLLSSALDQNFAQEALRRSEARFRSYFDLGLVGMMTSDASGRPLEVNDRLCEMLGYERDELLRKTSREVTCPEHLEISSAKFRALQTGEADRIFFDKCFIRKDGTLVHAIVSAASVRTFGGAIDHFVSIVQDVSEQKVAERELFRREQEFKALVENTPDVITRFDRDLRRRYINPAVEALTGIPASEFIGRSYDEINVTNSEAAGALRDVFVSGKGTTIEFTIPGPAGERVLHTRVVPEFDRNNEVEFALTITREITDIRRSEQRLRESETQLANAQRIARIGSFELTLDTGEMRWSDELFRLVGLPVGEPPSIRYLFSLVASEDRAAISRAYRAATTSGESQHLEYRLTRPNGRGSVFSISMEPTNPDGRVVKLAGTVQDVTDLRAAEQSVRNSEHRLRSLIDSASDAILTLDRRGIITQANPAAARMVGKPAETLPGNPIVESIHPDRLADSRDALRSVMQTGQPVHIEIPVKSSGGDFIDVEASVTRQDNGGEDAIFVIARDVTAQRRADTDREALMREIELLLASTYEGIYVLDASGSCTRVNASAERMLGYERREIVGERLHDLIHHKRPDGSPYPADACPIEAAARTQQQVHIVDETFWRRDGTSFPVEIFVSPIISDTGSSTGIVASFIDVTEQHALRLELERANRLAGLGRIAATMSHEFNNVLMGIQPFAEVLLRTNSDERVVNAATRITQSVRRGRRVTEELRRFTRPTPPARTCIDVASWLTDCASELGRMLPSNVRFSLEISPEAMKIEADRDQITQVVSNLVLNARDAIAPGAGTIVIRARIAGLRSRRPSLPQHTDGSFVQISIVDDGPGMSDEMQARIFEPFFTSKKNGTGLGLAITHQIITMHGGHIFVESEPGRGTTMQCLLPASTSAVEAQLPAVACRTREAAIAVEVLLVEDDEAVASGLQTLLEEADIRVLLADTGERALEILARATPQALIIDVGLPDTNGFDLYDRITSKFGKLPVVFSSGHADAGRVERMGPDAHAVLLTKPYAFEDLFEALEQLLDVTV